MKILGVKDSNMHFIICVLLCFFFFEILSSVLSRAGAGVGGEKEIC